MYSKKAWNYDNNFIRLLFQYLSLIVYQKLRISWLDVLQRLYTLNTVAYEFYYGTRNLLYNFHAFQIQMLTIAITRSKKLLPYCFEP